MSAEMARPCRNGADRAERHTGRLLLLGFLLGRLLLHPVTSLPSPRVPRKFVVFRTLGEGQEAVKGKIPSGGGKQHRNPISWGPGVGAISSSLGRATASCALCASRTPD